MCRVLSLNIIQRAPESEEYPMDMNFMFYGSGMIHLTWNEYEELDNEMVLVGEATI